MGVEPLSVCGAGWTFFFLNPGKIEMQVKQHSSLFDCCCCSVSFSFLFPESRISFSARGVLVNEKNKNKKQLPGIVFYKH